MIKEIGSPEIKRMLDIICEYQIADRDLWSIFADQFGNASDVVDDGWRGEYWGKVMRGAAIICEETGDDGLYDVLRESVEALLEKQELDGRISTYGRNSELHDWDVWCRKYVAVGLEYFLRICRDGNLKKRIIDALRAHMDYIIARVGPDKDLQITGTSIWWGGMNASSILKSFVVLYEITNEKKYLDFAEYIIAQGGANGFDIFRAAEENKFMPFEYPYTKAYEMISCFEGLLEYAKVTGNEKSVKICERFADAVIKSDFTVVGGSGCFDEWFNHSSVMQTIPIRTHMQETCVTVSLMLYFLELHRMTGEKKYQDLIERMFRNLYSGALNTEELNGENPLTFDSYSPLIRQRRAVLVAGRKLIAPTRYYGCCVAISPAGLGVFLSSAIRELNNVITVEQYIKGVLTVASGELKIATEYPKDGGVGITLSLKNAPVTLRLRIPEGCAAISVRKNGARIKTVSDGGYVTIDQCKDGDKLTVMFDLPYTVSSQTNIITGDRYCCVRRGPVVFATESDPKVPLIALQGDPEKFSVRTLENGVYLTDENGNGYPLIEYASAGKHWSKGTLVTCWYKCV